MAIQRRRNAYQKRAPLKRYSGVNKRKPYLNKAKKIQRTPNWIRELMTQTKYKYKYKPNQFDTQQVTYTLPEGSDTNQAIVNTVVYINPYERPPWCVSGGLAPELVEDIECQDKYFIRGGKYTVNIARESKDASITPSQPLRVQMWLMFNNGGDPPRSYERNNNLANLKCYLPEDDPLLKNMIKGKWHKDFELDVGKEVKYDFRIKPELISSREDWFAKKKNFPLIVIHMRGRIVTDKDEIMVGRARSMVFTKIYERIRCIDNTIANLRGDEERMKTLNRVELEATKRTFEKNIDVIAKLQPDMAAISSTSEGPIMETEFINKINLVGAMLGSLVSAAKRPRVN